jgi:biopolymer transport protein ExbB
MDNMWFAWWQEADWVVQAVFIILLALSVLSWTVIAFKVGRFVAVMRGEQRAAEGLDAGSDDVATLLPASLPSGRVHERSRRMLAQQPAAGRSRERLTAHFERWLGEQRFALGSNLTLLATIGNAAPFIGLFGTVWGIMHALQTLGAGAGLTLEAVAGPVGEALVATAAGLFTAIPAVIGYNLLVRWQNRIMALVAANAQWLLDATLDGEV